MKHDFVGMGFGKCGTTTLDVILRQHPQIALPCHKETVFFERADTYHKGLEWYESRYYGRDMQKYAGKIVGEINPRNVGMEKNVRMLFGEDVKFIYLLRNPVSACLSKYKHHVVLGEVYDTAEEHMYRAGMFDDFVDQYLYSRKREDWQRRQIMNSYLYGKYFATIAKYVPNSNIHIICFEDFTANTEMEVKKLLHYLGADETVPINYNVKKNVGNRIPKNVRALKGAQRKHQFWYRTFMYSTLYMGNWVENKMERWAERICDDASIHTDQGITMSEETRQKLKEYYREDVALLDATLGSDFAKRWSFS